MFLWPSEPFFLLRLLLAGGPHVDSGYACTP